ncbi:Hypothetical predicted protein [Pelobates cultripes]|uniref:Uncharacterized protein n=1 Tax=Pelobates cultripes TaxID=61616 RepID=A0AAD1SQJ5_PELCU|nr:Hypothetical predicted protein [Pelobates cultripes]
MEVPVAPQQRQLQLKPLHLKPPKMADARPLTLPRGSTESTITKLDMILEEFWRKLEERQRRTNSQRRSPPAAQRPVQTTQRRNGFASRRRTRPERSAAGGKLAHRAPPTETPFQKWI